MEWAQSVTCERALHSDKLQMLTSAPLGLFVPCHTVNTAVQLNISVAQLRLCRISSRERAISGELEGFVH